ncbi:MAG: hypothetical protein A2033_00700 [Bacteroidetes bacterium GWA2_31_9]|nr:MAG: hypothetical protein A2033_00700 [Bacteroidetes bacterium GWA2_31_9]
MKKTHVFTKTVMVLILCFTFNKVNSQDIQLDSLAYRYFSQEQIDTMSSKFILVQNYLIKYSWNIYRRWDKQRDTIVEFNRDTVDIRPYLNARKENKPSYIYNAYPGLVIELDSKSAIRNKILQIYSEN